MHSATSVTACLKVLHCSSTFDPRSCKTWNLLCRFSLYLSARSSFFSFSTAMGFFKEVLFIFFLSSCYFLIRCAQSKITLFIFCIIESGQKTKVAQFVVSVVILSRVTSRVIMSNLQVFI